MGAAPTPPAARRTGGERREVTVTEAEIIAFCESQLAGFKVPKSVVFGPLPRTQTGKVQKFVLRATAREL